MTHTWRTSTPADYEQAERDAIRRENEPLPGPVQRHWFLSRLFHIGDGWIELRALLPGTEPKRKFFAVGDFDGIEKFIELYSGDRNIYFGVAARRIKGDGSLTNCSVMRAFFGDIDFKITPETEARKRLAAFIYPNPTLRVRSGYGLHLYWVLSNPVDLQRNAADCKRRLVGMAEALGGDTGSAEPAHILRLPGTLNFKYSPPREVTLEHF